MNAPTLEDLQCLVMGPPGTLLEQQDQELCDALLSLMHKYGFGRVPQFASWIEKIWREPESIKQFKKMKREYLKDMADYWGTQTGE